MSDVDGNKRDHGGGLDAAIARFGGAKSDWVDLSTGINPDPYPVGTIPAAAWTALPDESAQNALLDAARRFWNVPENTAILAAHGASALIARLPMLWPAGRVSIQTPTYNEHAAAFKAHGWEVQHTEASVQVVVHPNNPDGRLWSDADLTAPFTIIDESFCDICPEKSHIDRTRDGQTLVLKSFGKFWGLAGLRVGFVMGDPKLLSQLSEGLGPWSVSGPALHIATEALCDTAWAQTTRSKLKSKKLLLDSIMQNKNTKLVGGTPLFRLYETADAKAFQTRLAESKIWSRIFPYSDKWIRLGLPPEERWSQLEQA